VWKANSTSEEYTDRQQASKQARDRGSLTAIVGHGVFGVRPGIRLLLEQYIELSGIASFIIGQRNNSVAQCIKNWTIHTDRMTTQQIL